MNLCLRYFGDTEQKKIILKINVHLNQIHSSRKFEKQTQVFVSL